MNLKALKVFTGVMDEGTLTDAAATLHLSQSAASRLLSLLEQEIGSALFRREKRQLIPTCAAEALYPEALRILAQITALPEVASGAKSATSLRIICHSRLAGGLVVPAIVRLAKAFPHHSVHLETAPRRELVRRVLAGRYDFAVAALPLSLGDRSARPLANLPLGIVLPRTHPLATKSALSLSDLTGLDYIALDETTAVRRALDTAFDAEGKKMVPSHEVSTGTNAYRLVAAGLGYTFADAVALDPEIRPGVTLVPWKKHVTMKIGYFPLGPEPSDAATAFERALTEIAADLSGRPPH